LLQHDALVTSGDNASVAPRKFPTVTSKKKRIEKKRKKRKKKKKHATRYLSNILLAKQLSGVISLTW
jgi:hypothetical protein